MNASAKWLLLATIWLAVTAGTTALAGLIPPSALPFYPNYCGDNHGGTDCSTEFNSWISDGIHQQRALYAPAGTYRLKEPVTVQLTSYPPSGTGVPSGSVGISIYCDGPQLTQFVFDTGAAAPNLQLVGQDWPVETNPITGVVGPTRDSVTYPVIRGCSFIGSTNGTLVQVGTYDFGDAINEPQFINDEFHNNTTGGSGVALQLNFVLNGFFDVVASAGVITAGMTGPPWSSGSLGFAALDCRACAFNNFFGSYGYANSAIVLRDGWTFGNTFHSIDAQVFTSAVVIPNENPPGSNSSTPMLNPLLNHDVFVGGTFLSGVYGINAPFIGDNSINANGQPIVIPPTGDIFINPNFQQVQDVPAACGGVTVEMSSLTGTCN